MERRSRKEADRVEEGRRDGTPIWQVSLVVKKKARNQIRGGICRLNRGKMIGLGIYRATISG